MLQARYSLRTCGSDSGFRFRTLTHLCQRRGWASAREGTLSVPGNASAPASKLALAPSWLFSHFPYGSFFDDFRQCHGSAWAWEKASATEQRLCMPSHRVPAFMVHLAGLRQESWGRRTLMRALGVWQDAADAVAPEAWVSARHAVVPDGRLAASSSPTSTSTSTIGRASDRSSQRVAPWTASGRLLVTDGIAAPRAFSTMGDYDRFAARLLLLGLMLKRRAVMPPSNSTWQLCKSSSDPLSPPVSSFDCTSQCLHVAALLALHVVPTMICPRCCAASPSHPLCSPIALASRRLIPVLPLAPLTAFACLVPPAPRAQSTASSLTCAKL